MIERKDKHSIKFHPFNTSDTTREILNTKVTQEQQHTTDKLRTATKYCSSGASHRISSKFLVPN